MKRISLLFFALILTFSLAACGSQKNATNTDQNTQVTNGIQSDSDDQSSVEGEGSVETNENASPPDESNDDLSATEGKTPADENDKEQDAVQGEDNRTSSDAETNGTQNANEEATPANLHHVEIEVANYGTISVELDSDVAPATVANFLSLAESGFYDGLTFHRIMDGFMIQGGDPNGNGTGGSSTTITGEFSDNGFENNLSHTRGVISMARSSDYNSASSQFFIVHEDSTFLDGQYAAFGVVTKGMEIVDQICADAKPTDSNGTISADQQPVITSIKVID